MDSILEQKLASLGEHIKQRTRERQAQTIEAPATALVIPFPHPWAEAVRACPLAMLRSALFGVVRRGRRGLSWRKFNKPGSPFKIAAKASNLPSGACCGSWLGNGGCFF